jgi:hypothetical protein
MPRIATGELCALADGYAARITIRGRDLQNFSFANGSSFNRPRRPPRYVSLQQGAEPIIVAPLHKMGGYSMQSMVFRTDSSENSACRHGNGAPHRCWI